MMEENTLLDRLRSGDADAIRYLVDTYQPMVLRTARGFVHSTDDARDITQVVFLDVVTHLHQFKGKSSISTWIYRITVNRSLNYLRHKQRRRSIPFSDSGKSQDDDPIVRWPDTDQQDPQEILEREERSRILHQALDALPEKQRIALTLAEFDDLSYKEIALVMELSISSIESLIFRAKKNLQKKLWKSFRGHSPQVF